jgi:hypothetical protein
MGLRSWVIGFSEKLWEAPVIEKRVTGNHRLRVGWFGLVIIEYEVEIYVDTRPQGQAYSPDWWTSHRLWLRCPRGVKAVITDTGLSVSWEGVAMPWVVDLRT